LIFQKPKIYALANLVTSMMEEILRVRSVTIVVLSAIGQPQLVHSVPTSY